MVSENNSITVVSQFLTRTHGQGKINLELISRLLRRGYGVRAVSTWLASGLEENTNLVWDRIRVPNRLPTNWLRCEAFRRQAQRIIGRNQLVAINNGAAAITPSIANIAMFVHSAWLHSSWRPSAWNGFQPALQAAFTAHQSKLEKRAFAMSQWVIALSEIGKQEVVEYCGIDESRVKVIPAGVDADTFRPRVASDRNQLRDACNLSRNDDRILALFVGEIRSARKNLDLVLRLLKNKPELLLAVIGSTKGSPYPALAQELKIDDRVFFLGQRSDVPSLMPGADVFVFPTHYEPFGLVVTEAMACGLPVIVTRQAGSSSVVEHGREGWLLEDGSDMDMLEFAMDKIREPKNRRIVGESARQKAVSLTWDKMTDSYEELLAGVISSKS